MVLFFFFFWFVSVTGSRPRLESSVACSLSMLFCFFVCVCVCVCVSFRPGSFFSLGFIGFAVPLHCAPWLVEQRIKKEKEKRKSGQVRLPG